MTELDDILVPTALELIDELGKLLEFTPPTGTYVPGAGEKTGVSPAPFERKASPPGRYDRSWVNGRVLEEGSSLVFVAASGLALAPAPGWTVDIDGATWRVVAVDALYSGELIAAYEVELRR